MISILETDVETSCSLVSEKVPGLFRSMNSFNGIARLYSISPKLCYSTLFVLPIVGISTISMSRLNSKQLRNLREKESNLLNKLTEKVNNITTIRLNNKEKQELNYLKDYFQNTLRYFFIKKNFFNSFFNSFVNFSSNLTMLILLNYGGELIRQGELTSGQLTSFLLQSGFVGLGLSSLSTFYGDYLKGIDATRRIFNVIDASKKKEFENLIDNDNLTEKNNFNGKILLKNVTFSYQNRSDIKIFSHLNLTINQNSITCFIGESGSGKSTLASLLCGLFQPNEGEIVYEGKEDKYSLVNKKILDEDMNIKKIYELFGVMEQNNNNLMSGTIKENVLYSMKEENDEDMEKITSLSSVFKFINEFPLKEETEIGKNGSLLSGGQKARLCLARALIKSPRYLLLDEPTSNLDKENEQEVIRLLKQFKNNTTLIIFTHSKELLDIADQVYRVENREIIKEK